MYSFDQIQSLQLEISTYCNASCPQCPRNFFGGKTIPDLPLKKWTLNDFKNIFTIDFLKQLKQIYLCGTYGDPMTNTKVVDICKFLKNNNPSVEIGLHTNGGIGSTETYQQLGPIVKFIAFGIDGLDDTNHLYRKHTKWKKIMQNAEIFISSGGYAIWDFIVFEHNQHQVEQARQLSKNMGFKEFNVKKTSRFINRSHQFNKSLDVLDHKGFIEYQISIPTVPEYVNNGYQKIIDYSKSEFKEYLSSCKISCNSKKIKEIYIGADGFVFPCGWLHDRLYGPEIGTHTDHIMIKKLMTDAGGWANTNVFYTPLEKIIKDNWFNILEKSWTSGQRLERCAMMCGENINVIGPQNADINYKL
jgi:MoaA/NifB/PqqE/SkfB family radical SAM enzyme